MSKKKINLGFFVRMVAPMVLVGLKEAVENIENEAAKAGLLFAVAEVENAVNLLTDGDKENGKQFAAYYKENWKKLTIELLNIIELLVPDPVIQEQLKKAKKGIS